MPKVKNIHFKLKILYYDIYEVLIHWRDIVWKSDLDQLVCCNGRDCFCGGETLRDTYEFINERKKKYVKDYK